MQSVAGSLTFGYFTAALLATAAIALATGLQFLLIGVRQRNDSTPLAFSLFCLCLATLAFSNALMGAASTLAVAILALRILCGAAIVALPALLLFVGCYTARPANRYVWWAVLALSLWLFLLNLISPSSAFDTHLSAGEPVVLPWGESLFTLKGTRATGGTVFRWLASAVFVWTLYRAVRQYLDGQRLRGALLGACLLLQFVAFLWTAIAVTTLGQPYPGVDSFAFLSFVLLMAALLAGQMHSHTLRLERTARDLRAEAETRRETELKLHHAAYHDALTGLPNRLRTRQILADLRTDCLRSGQHGAALIVDLDNFKTINDSLGHHVGDQVLAAVGDKLLAAATGATTVARLGGDEFVLLLSSLAASGDAAAAQAMQFADSVLQRMADPLTIDAHVIRVGASIGVALFPGHGADESDAIHRADIALHRAKYAGRNATRLYQADMQEGIDERGELERGLRSAIEHHELSLHFQPQVTACGDPAGAEALLRWHHPTLGDVSPATFIPIAEQTGLIHAIGAWVIADACDHVSAWRQRGVDIGGRLAINVSPWQIADPNFTQRIAAQVTAAGVDPAWLTLELTESALLNDFDAALATLHRLSAAGFHLAMDDFGTGYSSLAYLQQLPLNELKIDQSFVRALQPSVSDPFVSFIIDMGRGLGMTITAEGVETLQQKAILEGLGCHILQGHLISRPVPAAEFANWLSRHGNQGHLPPNGPPRQVSMSDADPAA